MADHTVAAAKIIAAEARRLASRWSVQVPPSIRVTGGGTSATITSAVGPSYPNEVAGVRHPVYGNRHNWVLNQYRPFLAPATDAKADAAAEEVAKVVDDIAHAAGFVG
jgi:hypothetical protein